MWFNSDSGAGGEVRFFFILMLMDLKNGLILVGWLLFFLFFLLQHRCLCSWGRVFVCSSSCSLSSCSLSSCSISSFSSSSSLVSDLRTKGKQGTGREKKMCFHTSCFHSSLLPVQWKSWWSLNEAELGDQADTGAGVGAASTLLHLLPWESGEAGAAALDEMERKWTRRE